MLGINSMVTMQSWMFLSSFEDLRIDIINNRTIGTMAHFGARAFNEISGEVVQTTAFAVFRNYIKNYIPTFFRLVEGTESEKSKNLREKLFKYDSATVDSLHKISGSPIAYWASTKSRTLSPITLHLTQSEGLGRALQLLTMIASYVIGMSALSKILDSTVQIVKMPYIRNADGFHVRKVEALGNGMAIMNTSLIGKTMGSALKML